MKNKKQGLSNFIMYTTEDGLAKIEARFEDNTLWLSQDQIATLFDRSKSTINEHIQNVYQEKELSEENTKRFGNSEFMSKSTIYFNLNMIIAVGYRVKSLRGTQFRIWATNILKEYMQKGFAMNDDVLKNNGGGVYWEELLSRIRGIRASERVFYRQVLDIYATSIDYNPTAKETLEFFKIVQNKMHFAVHGNTAAEIEYKRADSQKPLMGLTGMGGKEIKKTDVVNAKNYLTEEELDLLNRLTAAYLEFAEFQALSKTPMYMKDWIRKLDEYITLLGKNILTNAGTISKEQADKKALEELEKYMKRLEYIPSEIEKEYLKSLGKIEKQLSKKDK